MDLLPKQIFPAAIMMRVVALMNCVKELKIGDHRMYHLTQM